MPAPKSTRQSSTAPNLQQVAARAGISVATASAVLNAPQANTRVSAATRERVLAAARELRYHPNALARALVGGSTKTLGVLFGLERASVAVTNPFVFTVLQGIVTAAAEVGYNVTLFTEPWHDADRSAGPFRDRRTDGVVVVAPATDSDIVPSLVELGVPLVSVGTPAEAQAAPSVDVDNIAGTRLAVRHLIELGHTRIAHITGDDNLRSAHERRAAFEQTLREAGIPVRPEYILPGQYSSVAGREGLQKLLALPEPPTAIFAANDNIARGVMKEASEAGLTIPEQLSLVGFDGLPTASSASFLTTVRQPLNEIGAEAARLLLRLLKGEEIPTEAHLFTPELIIQNSTRAL
jgi:DNA-binding LacI/PurR family transcriptional regulator